MDSKEYRVPVFEVATLKELSEWLGRKPQTLLIKFLTASLEEDREVMRQSGSTWIIDVRFALKHYKPIKERPVR